MVLVKMKSTEMGAPNGYDPQPFEEGKEYNLPEHLAKPWIEAGKAAPIGADIETKAIISAPENKSEHRHEVEKDKYTPKAKDPKAKPETVEKK